MTSPTPNNALDPDMTPQSASHPEPGGEESGLKEDLFENKIKWPATSWPAVDITSAEHILIASGFKMDPKNAAAGKVARTLHNSLLQEYGLMNIKSVMSPDPEGTTGDIYVLWAGSGKTTVDVTTQKVSEFTTQVKIEAWTPILQGYRTGDDETESDFGEYVTEDTRTVPVQTDIVLGNRLTSKSISSFPDGTESFTEVSSRVSDETGTWLSPEIPDTLLIHRGTKEDIYDDVADSEFSDTPNLFTDESYLPWEEQFVLAQDVKSGPMFDTNLLVQTADLQLQYIDTIEPIRYSDTYVSTNRESESKSVSENIEILGGIAAEEFRYTGAATDTTEVTKDVKIPDWPLIEEDTQIRDFVLPPGTAISQLSTLTGVLPKKAPALVKIPIDIHTWGFPMAAEQRYEDGEVYYAPSQISGFDQLYPSIRSFFNLDDQTSTLFVLPGAQDKTESQPVLSEDAVGHTERVLYEYNPDVSNVNEGLTTDKSVITDLTIPSKQGSSPSPVQIDVFMSPSNPATRVKVLVKQDMTTKCNRVVRYEDFIGANMAGNRNVEYDFLFLNYIAPNALESNRDSVDTEVILQGPSEMGVKKVLGFHIPSDISTDDLSNFLAMKPEGLGDNIIQPIPETAEVTNLKFHFESKPKECLFSQVASIRYKQHGMTTTISMEFKDGREHSEITESKAENNFSYQIVQGGAVIEESKTALDSTGKPLTMKVPVGLGGIGVAKVSMVPDDQYPYKFPVTTAENTYSGSDKPNEVVYQMSDNCLEKEGRIDLVPGGVPLKLSIPFQNRSEEFRHDDIMKEVIEEIRVLDIVTTSHTTSGYYISAEEKGQFMISIIINLNTAKYVPVHDNVEAFCNVLLKGDQEIACNKMLERGSSVLKINVPYDLVFKHTVPRIKSHMTSSGVECIPMEITCFNAANVQYNVTVLEEESRNFFIISDEKCCCNIVQEEHIKVALPIKSGAKTVANLDDQKVIISPENIEEDTSKLVSTPTRDVHLEEDNSNVVDDSTKTVVSVEEKFQMESLSQKSTLPPDIDKKIQDDACECSEENLYNRIVSYNILCNNKQIAQSFTELKRYSSPVELKIPVDYKDIDSFMRLPVTINIIFGAKTNERTLTKLMLENVPVQCVSVGNGVIQCTPVFEFAEDEHQISKFLCSPESQGETNEHLFTNAQQVTVPVRSIHVGNGSINYTPVSEFAEDEQTISKTIPSFVSQEKINRITFTNLTLQNLPELSISVGDDTMQCSPVFKSVDGGFMISMKIISTTMSQSLRDQQKMLDFAGDDLKLSSNVSSSTPHTRKDADKEVPVSEDMSTSKTQPSEEVRDTKKDIKDSKVSSQPEEFVKEVYDPDNIEAIKNKDVSNVSSSIPHTRKDADKEVPVSEDISTSKTRPSEEVRDVKKDIKDSKVSSQPEEFVNDPDNIEAIKNKDVLEETQFDPVWVDGLPKPEDESGKEESTPITHDKTDYEIETNLENLETTSDNIKESVDAIPQSTDLYASPQGYTDRYLEEYNADNQLEEQKEIILASDTMAEVEDNIQEIIHSHKRDAMEEEMQEILLAETQDQIHEEIQSILREERESTVGEQIDSAEIEYSYPAEGREITVSKLLKVGGSPMNIEVPLGISDNSVLIMSAELNVRKTTTSTLPEVQNYLKKEEEEEGTTPKRTEGVQQELTSAAVKEVGMNLESQSIGKNLFKNRYDAVSNALALYEKEIGPLKRDLEIICSKVHDLKRLDKAFASSDKYRSGYSPQKMGLCNCYLCQKPHTLDDIEHPQMLKSTSPAMTSFGISSFDGKSSIYYHTPVSDVHRPRKKKTRKLKSAPGNLYKYKNIHPQEATSVSKFSGNKYDETDQFHSTDVGAVRSDQVLDHSPTVEMYSPLHKEAQDSSKMFIPPEQTLPAEERIKSSDQVGNENESSLEYIRARQFSVKSVTDPSYPAPVKMFIPFEESEEEEEEEVGLQTTRTTESKKSHSTGQKQSKSQLKERRSKHSSSHMRVTENRPFQTPMPLEIQGRIDLGFFVIPTPLPISEFQYMTPFGGYINYPVSDQIYAGNQQALSSQIPHQHYLEATEFNPHICTQKYEKPYEKNQGSRSSKCVCSNILQRRADQNLETNNNWIGENERKWSPISEMYIKLSRPRTS